MQTAVLICRSDNTRTALRKPGIAIDTRSVLAPVITESLRSTVLSTRPARGRSFAPNGLLPPTLGQSVIVFSDEKKLALEGRIAQCLGGAACILGTHPPKVSVPDRI